MTFSTYIVFAIVLFFAIQYNKLIDRERMYKQYYNFALKKMEVIGIDPVQVYVEMVMEYSLEFNQDIAKAAIEDAFVHHFRTLGVKIENLKIYWNE